MNTMSYVVEVNGDKYKVTYISLVGTSSRQSDVRLKFAGSHGLSQLDVPAWWWWSRTELPLKLATGSTVRRLTLDELYGEDT